MAEVLARSSRSGPSGRQRWCRIIEVAVRLRRSRAGFQSIASDGQTGDRRRSALVVDCVYINGAITPWQRNHTKRSHLDLSFDEFSRARRKQHARAGSLVGLLQTLCEVHGIPVDRIPEPGAVSDRPRDHTTRVDADARAQSDVVAEVSRLDTPLDVERRPDRAKCVIGIRQRQIESHQHCIALELRDDAAPGPHAGRQRGEVIVEKRKHVLRRVALANPGETLDVAVQDRGFRLARSNYAVVCAHGGSHGLRDESTE